MDNKARLSDRILTALELSLDQQDVEISEILLQALEQSMTRKSGGGEFVERRDYTAEMEKIMTRLRALRNSE